MEPQLGQVILLIFAETAVFAIGFLACCLGLLVAIPLMTCISTAAYRQIFGTEDRTGLLAEEPPAGGSLV